MTHLKYVSEWFAFIILTLFIKEAKMLAYACFIQFKLIKPQR